MVDSVYTTAGALHSHDCIWPRFVWIVSFIYVAFIEQGPQVEVWIGNAKDIIACGAEGPGGH